jgi:uncharacterized membrane protein YiaA
MVINVSENNLVLDIKMSYIYDKVAKNKVKNLPIANVRQSLHNIVFIFTVAVYVIVLYVATYPKCK